MYDLQYVRRRRRRKIAAFVSLVTAIGVAALVTTSFLGRTVGTFTVAVTNTSVRLALSKKSDLSETTSYLRVEKLYALHETTREDLPADDLLDSDGTEYDYGKVMDEEGNYSLLYVKYTFFVTNLSYTPARFTLTVNLGDRNKSEDGTDRSLDDTLRVMIYENDPSKGDDHYSVVYAKEASEYNIDKDGNKTRREFISSYPSASNQEDDEHKLAETFESGQGIVKRSVRNFRKGDVMRYTVVFWLEGEDPQSDNSKEIPEGASLKLGVDIAAYEND